MMAKGGAESALRWHLVSHFSLLHSGRTAREWGAANLSYRHDCDRPFTKYLETESVKTKGPLLAERTLRLVGSVKRAQLSPKTRLKITSTFLVW